MPISPSKKTQTRQCSACKRVGHNKATCPEKLTPATPTAYPRPKSAPAPIRFFVHHVPYSAHRSSHVVDLKKERHDVWSKVQSSSPKTRHDDSYYFYHQPSKKRLDVRPLAAPFFRGQKIKGLNKFFSAETLTFLADEPVQKYSSSIAFAAKRPANSMVRFIRSKYLASRHRTAKLATDLSFLIARVRQKTATNIQAALGAIKSASAARLTIRRLAPLITLFIIIVIVPTRANTYYQSLKSTTAAIADKSTTGFLALQESTSAIMVGNLATAETSLQNALQNFDQAVDIMRERHQSLQKILSSLPILGAEVKSRQNLIWAGQELTLGNTYMVKGLSENQNASTTFTSRVAILAEHLRAAIPNYQKALQHLSLVDEESLPFEYQNVFQNFKLLFTAFLNDLENVAKLSEPIQEIFGGKGQRRYLLVFQNPHEIRPTGGFMGSFAILDIKDGEVVNLSVPAGGTYDVQGQLSQYVEPPAPLLLSNKRWEMQDANWFPHFPASAEKILWFYRQSRGVTGDGVIAINATVLTRLLAITGPITDEKRQLVIASDNAIFTIQDVVEHGDEKKDNKPKQIIANLASKFVEYFQNASSDKILPLLANLQDALARKEIQLYFTDARAENSMKEFGWNGGILPSGDKQDYLMVVNTNIQGQKSDASIKQTVSHESLIEEDGTILTSVTITREHLGKAGEKLYGETNIDYVRVYVPEGSQLIGARGFTWPDEKKFRAPESWYKKDETLQILETEVGVDSLSGTRITNEFNKTTFGNWIITEPGQTSQVQFVYELPFKAFEIREVDNSLSKWNAIFRSASQASRYQLIVQRQSGSDMIFDSQIIYPDLWQPAWSEGNQMQLAKNGAKIEPQALEQDRVWSLVMEKNR